MAAILAYHRIAHAQTDFYNLCVTPDAFRSQLDYLRTEYVVMPLSALIKAVQAGRVPERTVAITLDDGYIDNYTHASPILSELGLPATFFITTDRLSEWYEYWWDTLVRIFLGPGPRLPASLALDLPSGCLSLSTDTPENCHEAHATIYRALFDEPADPRDDAIRRIIEWSGRPVSPDLTHRRMNATEVSDLSQRSGHEIGAHSVRHVALPKQSAAVQEAEIRDSRDYLQSLVAGPVAGFAYPFGAADEQTRSVASRWVDYAVTIQGQQLTAAADIYRLPRFEIRSDRRVAFDEWLHQSGGA